MNKKWNAKIIFLVLYLLLVILFYFVAHDTSIALYKRPKLAGSSNNFIYLPVIVKPSNFNFDIAENVPEADEQDIKFGIGYAQTEIEGYFGGDIPVSVQTSITVKMVATGLGNQEPGGGGACCTALDESEGRPFFDVLHPHWLNNPPPPYTLKLHHQTVASHEYVHVWQWYLGCLDIHHQPLGDWMNEGIAHYIGHAPFIRNGIMTAEDVRDFQLTSAVVTGQADVPLESLEISQGLWPGHIGYLAVEFLVSESPSGQLSIRDICEQVGDGVSVDQAFVNAFGMTKEYFYETAWPQYFSELQGH